MNPIWAIVAIILGVTLYKQFDFQTMQFEKPAMAVIYAITFVAAIFFLIKGRKRRIE
jgi:membrane protein DedA with SNARE-associated domain